MRKTPLIIAVALVIVGSAAIVLAIGGKSSSSGHAPKAALPVATLNCIGGSEKQVLMEDPQLQSILLDRYHLRVNFQPMGSYQQVQLTTAQLQAQHIDCLWPSSDSAEKVFEATHLLSAFPDYRAATVLESPEVLYSGPQSTAALLRAGIVQEHANRYFIVSMKQLLVDLVLKSRTWASLGAQDIARPSNPVGI